ncbi:microfibril-associated glycoprotein 4-like [Tribolium madens]|uniref:microfibril-associated glycoprotein 4-like n=1 Tax=Tribolium madens TaxID=41895 RepID=UPI001CF73E4E|nr:microfibril-associated glycoprotein 4-like [Tribolium madens]
MFLNVWLFLILVLAQNESSKVSSPSIKKKSTSSHSAKKPSQRVPKNCEEVQNSGHNTSGIYKIQPKSSPKPFEAFCDMKNRDGGWTYFFNRFDGSVSFDRGWKDYKKGFGNLSGEFWLGLTHLHELTADGKYQLLVELEDWDKVKAYAHYNEFAIGSEKEGFSLKVLKHHSGDVEDSLMHSVGAKFSTKDKSHDEGTRINCVERYRSAWWFKKCMLALLTGKYMKGKVTFHEMIKPMYWGSFHGNEYSLKKAKMMVKPISKSYLQFIQTSDALKKHAYFLASKH